MNFLYWNLNNNNLIEVVKECMEEHCIDIAVFSEFGNTLLEEIGSPFSIVESKGGTDRVLLVHRDTIHINLLREQARYAIYELNCGQQKTYLSGIHLQDQFHSDDEIRKQTIRELMCDMDELREQGEPCIIIGDFNASPFSEELLLFNCFNATLFKEVIQNRKYRMVENAKYERLYNPILDYISASDGMYGSYYHSGEPATTVWHCLDQVLVSEGLADCILNFKYLRKIKDKCLIKEIKPNDKEFSDHLPLVTSINLFKGDKS